jgi:hypothetical protein
MNGRYASRHFRYNSEPEEIRDYLSGLGYTTDEIYDRDLLPYRKFVRIWHAGKRIGW